MFLVLGVKNVSFGLRYSIQDAVIILPCLKWNKTIVNQNIFQIRIKNLLKDVTLYAEELSDTFGRKKLFDFVCIFVRY